MGAAGAFVTATGAGADTGGVPTGAVGGVGPIGASVTGATGASVIGTQGPQ
jgi:hypothetical protein